MNQSRLFHISEDPGIKIFEPRAPRSSHHQIKEMVVWAVAESYLYNYLLPRNCPRVSFYAMNSTREEDVELFLEGQRTKRVLAVEACWFNRIVNATLIQYEFAPDNFYLFDEPAGYYLSQHAEIPISVQMIAAPLERLLAPDVEVRLTPSLWELRERVLNSSLGFSFIRMNHATLPLAGYEAYHVV